MIASRMPSLLLLLACLLAASLVAAEKRAVKIMNESGKKLSLYWIHPQTRQESLMSQPHIFNGATFPLDSFVGHEFEIREAPGADGTCQTEDKTCRASTFKVSANNNQVVRVTPTIQAVITDDQTMARDEATNLIESCQSSAKAADLDNVELAVERFVQCVESGVATTLEKANEEIAYQASVRKDMANLLENYTCADYDLPTSPTFEERQWHHTDGITRNVHVKHERPASRIHVIENFISDEECQAMEETAEPQLHVATVADGKGGSQFSENRKAMQAGITVRWNKEAEGDHIAQLSRRVYDYANHVLGLDIKEHGQEDLMSIQYFGRGTNDTSPDRYTPHCDGDCTGLPHKPGTRMATMVMYCTLPKVGGATNFRNSGVHVQPQRGNAIFFSYIDPETRIMDNGFTEHSGCPVIEGEKKIVTQWIRLGVDSENPWDSFNTLGIKKSDADDQ